MVFRGGQNSEWKQGGRPPIHATLATAFILILIIIVLFEFTRKVF